MIDQNALALLREALDLLNDAPRLSLRRDRSRNSYRLASKIDAYLAQGDAPALDDVVAVTRTRWRADDHVRIDARPTMRLDADGMWISAWLLAGAGPGGADPALSERYKAVVDSLPVMTREVFLLHRRDGQSYPAIATRLGIGVPEVQQHLVDALMRLDAVAGDD